MILATHVEESSQAAFRCSGPLRSHSVSGPLFSQSLSWLKPFTTLVDSSAPCPAICPPITIRAATIERDRADHRNRLSPLLSATPISLS